MDEKNFNKSYSTHDIARFSLTSVKNKNVNISTIPRTNCLYAYKCATLFKPHMFGKLVSFSNFRIQFTLVL